MPGVPAHERLLTISRGFPAGVTVSLTRILVVVGALAIDLWVWGGDTRLVTGAPLPVGGVVVGLVVLALGYAVLALWRSPVPGYAALWLLSFAGLAVPALESLAGFLVALFLMARMMPRAVAVMALIGSAVPVTVNTITGLSFHDDATAVFGSINAALWTVLMLAVWSAGLLAGRSLHRLDTERRWAEDARAEALALERLTISREIHDTVAHGLSGIVLQAAGARAGLARGTVSDTDVDAAFASIQQAGEQGMRELHVLLGMLREPALRENETASVDGVHRLVATARASGLDARLSHTGAPQEPDPSIARAAYRVVQEGLSNVMKHAGTGAAVDVTLGWEPEWLTVTVANTAGTTEPARGADGSEPRHLTGGYGLAGLRERLTVVAGTLHIDNADNAENAEDATDGFVLRAQLPLTPARGTSDREQNP